MTLEDFRKAVIALIACYYAIPKEVENTLLYTEQYLLGTKDDSSSNTSYISKMTIFDRLSENRPKFAL